MGPAPNSTPVGTPMGLLKKGHAAPAPSSKCVWCGAMTPDSLTDCQNCGRALRVGPPKAYQAPAKSPRPAPPPPAIEFFQSAAAPQSGLQRGPSGFTPPAYAAAPTTMSGPPEQVIGIIESLGYGSAAFDLVFTDLRIVGVYVGLAGGGSTLTGAAIGALANAGEKGKRASYAGLPLEAIMASNPKNWQVANAQVSSGLLHGGTSGISVPRLTLWMGKKRDEFEFFKQNWARNDGVLRVAKAILDAALGPRMTYKKV